MFKLRSRKIIQKERIGKWTNGSYDAHPQFNRIQFWASGEISLDERPDLSNYDPEKGINLYDTFEFEDWIFEDGYHEWAFPVSMSEQEKAAIIRIDEEGDLVDDNWEVIESETWFYGHLDIEECLD